MSHHRSCGEEGKDREESCPCCIRHQSRQVQLAGTLVHPGYQHRWHSELELRKQAGLKLNKQLCQKRKKMVFTLIFVLVWTMEETALYIKRSFQCLTKSLVLTTLLTIFYDVCVDYVVIHMSKGSLWTWNHCCTPSALEENSTDMYSCVQPMHKKLQGTPSLPFPAQHSSQWLLMR